MTRRDFTAALALLPAGLRAAETLQEKGRRVIDKCIDALGGDAFRQLPGTLQTGKAYRFYNDKISGLSPAKIYTKYLETPQGDATAGKTLREVQRQVLGRNDDEAVLLNVTEGWDITYRGAEPIPADKIDQFREVVLTDIFYILRARLDEPNMSLFSRGADVVENQPTEIVDYYDADNRNVTVWFHSSTWLPVRQLVKRWDPLIKDRREEMTHFTKYRDAGNGVMWPHEIQRDRDDEKTYQLISDSVKTGVFADSMFVLPPNVKILKTLKKP
jgi:hypothetical protein